MDERMHTAVNIEIMMISTFGKITTGIARVNELGNSER
jgi:hypothetical protein